MEQKKTYEVELRRESYVVLTVEADNEEQAEKEAWAEIERNPWEYGDASWSVESIEERKVEEGVDTQAPTDAETGPTGSP